MTKSNNSGNHRKHCYNRSFNCVNRRKPPETGTGEGSSGQKWKDQLREIQTDRLDKLKRISQENLATLQQHQKISKKFWPQITEVCQEFAASAGCTYKEKNIESLSTTGCYSSGCEIAGSGIKDSVSIIMRTECYHEEHKSRKRVYGNFGDNPFQTCVYGSLYYARSFNWQDKFAFPVHRFTKELLVTELRKITKV